MKRSDGRVVELELITEYFRDERRIITPEAGVSFTVAMYVVRFAAAVLLLLLGRKGRRPTAQVGKYRRREGKISCFLAAFRHNASPGDESFRIISVSADTINEWFLFNSDGPFVGAVVPPSFKGLLN